MPPNLLILGGTTEASALAKLVAEAGLKAVLSYAGRVKAPREQPVPVRVGGFGGMDGLADHLRANAVTHVVDATHPFAAQMSRNARAACDATGIPLIALTRPAWVATEGDRWQHVPGIDAAIAALNRPAQHVFLAIGQTDIARFVAQPQHHYLLRLVDRPEIPPALPQHQVVVDRGPFKTSGDIALMLRHKTQLIVSKNAGGTGAKAKLDAARALGLPVMMVDRPVLPDRPEVADPVDVINWVHQAA